MLVLGIESTCDETAVALVESGKTILSNIIYSQSEEHEKYGGVVPELASRKHLDVIIPVLKEALEKANKTLDDIDLVAAARGPGLMGALLIGLNVAKSLSLALNKPFVGVNHSEAHLYASMMPNAPEKFPCLGVLLSGGHTALVHIDEKRRYRILGTTVDDAIGEAFDKVASLLGYPYPGGPFVENLALDGDPYKYSFNAGQVKKNPLDFSFSGLKTNVLYTIKGQNNNKARDPLSEQEKHDIAASFQRAAFSDVVNKTLLALDKTPYNALILGGGVTSSRTLKKMFSEALPDLPQFWPTKALATDNAAMIAGLAFHQFKNEADSLHLKASPRIPHLI
ncbi:MAG: tRNA N6-adenosine threonylcarbamoyltransferase [Chlamydiae bacterium]|nr:tRNA N6-adenosine threonylcarbamoyltransferase [Chlamydiota bacterium]